MKNHRGVLVLATPVLAILALMITAAALRRESVPAAAPLRGTTSTASMDAGPAGGTGSRPVQRREVAATPVTAEKAVANSDLARIRGTYRNFRSAVAAGNQSLQASLKTALQADESVAVRFAQEELARATTDLDRDIATRTLKALRRTP